MQNFFTKIDHIVYAVPDLEKAMDEMENQIGIRPVIGGRHLNQGTHNALLHLGYGCYLELLAVDENNSAIKAPRWMGIDLITQPKITRWALKSEQIEHDAAILQKAHPDMGIIQEGSRKKTDGTILSWAMAMPLAKPEVEALPFLVDWKASRHPTKDLEQRCLLTKLLVQHPFPKKIEAVLRELGAELVVEKGESVQLTIEVETLKGKVSI